MEVSQYPFSHYFVYEKEIGGVKVQSTVSFLVVIKGAFDLPYSGIGMHGIQVGNPSFLRRFTLKLSNNC